MELNKETARDMIAKATAQLDSSLVSSNNDLMDQIVERNKAMAEVIVTLKKVEWVTVRDGWKCGGCNMLAKSEGEKKHTANCPVKEQLENWEDYLLENPQVADEIESS